ncbi:MAG: Gfo/Idh/MocA family oxidoreductase [Cyclobacteriaceae bacterium]|nr:Gfo/Idh/MocA family oxidoreductase [Cyclobacteriaceae bacterium]
MENADRRNFLKQSSLATAAIIAAPMILQSCSEKAASDRINLAVIGAGNQGTNDTRMLLEDERVQITAICDVNRRSPGYWDGVVAGREVLREEVEAYYTEKSGKKYKGVKEYADFREVIERKDIDAVLIALPDHWHSIPVLMAAAAKKDIYCQKPLSLTIGEGRAMSDAVSHHNVILQTGSQQRSNHHFRRVCELVRNGRIGALHTVKCGLPPGTPDFGRTGLNFYPQAVPEDFDFDMWLGPAPVAAYSPCRTFVNFRWVQDYSGGQLTDWGGHHPDIAQWGMDTELTGPVKIQNAKASVALHPVWNTASAYYFEAIYKNNIKLIVSSNERFGVTFEGSEGSVWADRESHGASDPAILDSVIASNEVQLYKSDDHFRNFIDCVYSRAQPIAPAEVAHRSITIAHLGNIAMTLKQDLEWNPDTEMVVNNDNANRMLRRPMRAPWDKVFEKYRV